MSNGVTAVGQHALVPGTNVGPWLIQQHAGAGSYGVVFRAQRAGYPEADPVALKVARLPRDARFEREGELLRRHQHPAIPRFEDAGLWTSPSGQVYPYPIRNALPTEEGAPFSESPESEEAGSDSEEPSGTGTATSASESQDGSSSSTGSIRRRRQRRRHSFVSSAWFSWASAGSVGGVVVAAALEFRRPHPPGPPEPSEPVPWSVSEEWHAPEVDIPDAGVGEKALLSAVQAPRPVSSTYGVSLPMPKAPQPGQKKPPCDGAEVAALGACWVVLDKKPPCGSLGYELESRCVRASFEAPREPTSGEP